MCKPPSAIKANVFEQCFMMTTLKGQLKESLEEIDQLKKEIKELKQEIKIISSISKEWFTSCK